MKKVIVLVSLMLFSFLSGCWGPDPEGRSPEEIVRRRFNNYNENIAETIAIKYGEGPDYNYSGIDYVNLISCKERKDRTVGAWFELPGKTFYLATNVDVTFEIKFKKGNAGEYCESGIYSCSFILVKEKAQSEWEMLGDPGDIMSKELPATSKAAP